MDTLEINKIVGAVVGTLLVFLGAQFFADAIFRSHGHEEYAFSIAIEPEEEEAAEEVDLATLIASADAGRGERVFAKCRACHQIEDGANGTGPHLHAVVGRPIGAVDGFGYSGALAATGETEWSPENLYAYLARPSAWAPGTSMGFAGLPKSEDRAAVIAYLATLTN